MGGEPTRTRKVSAEDGPLGVLRALLARDYLATADSRRAVADLASMVRDALGSQEAMVALWNASTRTWEAVTSEGECLEGPQIRARGSLTALERVRTTGRAEFTTGEAELRPRTPSVHRRSIAGVLVAPLALWDLGPTGATPRFGGCLYAHRTPERPPFTEEDVALVMDVARIAQPTLSLLAHVDRIARDLEGANAELDALRARSAQEHHFGHYRTRDARFAEQVLTPLSRAALVDRVGLLILGPTGSGKSHLAESYHNECVRKGRPFVVVNCGSFRSAAVLSPELFGFGPDSGYENAPRRGRPGKAQLADGGTLFLDEIGTLPLELQPQLLRLIEQGRFTPLGATEEVEVDVQVIAATNEDLPALVREGRFREDLYWRLCDVVITLPPLSERLLDLDAIAERLVSLALARTGRRDVERLGASAMQALREVDWSRAGNVRGLAKTIERSIILAPPGTRVLERRELVFHGVELPAASPPGASARRKDELEAVKAAIREHGSAMRAAQALGMPYRRLYWKLQRAGLSVGKILLS